ncbi:hypothetical protein [Gilliamella apis]|nr:hypothetical protein [Gilliamella apis]
MTVLALRDVNAELLDENKTKVTAKILKSGENKNNLKNRGKNKLLEKTKR